MHRIQCFCFVLACILANESLAIGWDADDFLITEFRNGNVGVYDADLSFKGFLDASYPRATGLDFNRHGQLIVASQGNPQGVHPQVRVYSSGGILIDQFTNDDLGTPVDAKVGPAGTWFIGANLDAGLREFSNSGEFLRELDGGDYEGVGVLPNGTVWGGRIDPIPLLNIFDARSGNKIDNVELDAGQIVANAMSYSPLTGTVLIADREGDAVFERDTEGRFLRRFVAPGLNNPFGVTRGPNGDVYATSSGRSVFHWRADASFVAAVSLVGNSEPINSVWAGNARIIPEPSTLALTIASISIAGYFRRPPQAGRLGQGRTPGASL